MYEWFGLFLVVFNTRCCSFYENNIIKVVNVLVDDLWL